MKDVQNMCKSIIVHFSYLLLLYIVYYYWFVCKNYTTYYNSRLNSLCTKSIDFLLYTSVHSKLNELSVSSLNTSPIVDNLLITKKTLLLFTYPHC